MCVCVCVGGGGGCMCHGSCSVSDGNAMFHRNRQVDMLTLSQFRQLSFKNSEGKQTIFLQL